MGSIRLPTAVNTPAADSLVLGSADTTLLRSLASLCCLPRLVPFDPPSQLRCVTLPLRLLTPVVTETAGLRSFYFHVKFPPFFLE